MTPLVLIFVMAAVFLLAERWAPGRALPHAPGWHARAALLNAGQLAIFVLGGHAWGVWLQGPSLFALERLGLPVVEGLLCWFVGTFVFYWWHRARHASPLLWRCLHQIHHSPARIETLTAFYKHPLEIAINSVLSTAIIFPLLGASVEAAGWYGFFAALGEFCYHGNLRTPRAWGWFLQRPEQHAIHHQVGVHHFNYGDITWWDRLFGTFREADATAPACGFEGGREQQLGAMLMMRDVHRDDGA
jgi:sterol desaturase/sphingolipid hydroxylase (fatty acid hydroxylase superfamily)